MFHVHMTILHVQIYLFQIKSKQYHEVISKLLTFHNIVNVALALLYGVVNTKSISLRDRVQSVVQGLRCSSVSPDR